ncbi:hypothetical protein HPB48_002340 [Haemaphysalis longicornis]|uniref:Anaphase-promoting complex subunit CDC26 n=1 Tax=Haemaphysalis longicornis TaxID=44386 RepID=A0A9J6FS73_HAELO|nr:hypothetical protein HPB48_002340 [Haemaphysalis longicornis]
MYRRQPTRIEVKLDDLQEYEALKKEWDDKGASVCELAGSASGKEPPNPDSPASPPKPTVHERIGYKPEPRVAS